MTSESSFHGHLASYIWTEHRSDRNLWPKKVDKGEGEKEWTRGRKKWVQYRTPRTDPPNYPLPPAGPYPKHLLFPNNAIEGLIHWLSQSPPRSDCLWTCYERDTQRCTLLLPRCVALPSSWLSRRSPTTRKYKARKSQQLCISQGSLE